MSAIFLSSSARSSSVRNGRSLYLAGRCSGSSESLVQIPCRSGSPQAVTSLAPAVAFASTGRPREFQEQDDNDEDCRYAEHLEQPSVHREPPCGKSHGLPGLRPDTRLPRFCGRHVILVLCASRLRRSLRFLGLRRQLVRSARSRRAEEQLASVCEREIPAVGPLRSVLGPVSVDDDLRAGQQRILGEASPEQHVRRAGFDRPVLDRCRPASSRRHAATRGD